jgi:hypothetical protein
MHLLNQNVYETTPYQNNPQKGFKDQVNLPLCHGQLTVFSFLSNMCLFVMLELRK